MISKKMASRPMCLLVTSIMTLLSLAVNGSQMEPHLAMKALWYGFPPLALPAGAEVRRPGKPDWNEKGSVKEKPVSEMPELIQNVFLPECFPVGSNVNDWTMRKSPRDIHESKPGYDIIFPVTRTTAMAPFQHSESKYQFIPIVESPGISILKDTSKMESLIVKSLLGTWQLGLILVCTAVLAGVIIWCLETLWNEENFPRPFLKGIWYIDTGYGDKTPVTIPGRVFAFLWILIGIMIMSVFTATLAAAINADTASASDINGLKVGVLNGTVEEWLALGNGAEVTPYSDIISLTESLRNGIQEAILFDALFTIQEAARIGRDGIHSVALIHKPLVHGILFYNVSTETVGCLHDKANEHHYKIPDAILINSKISKKYHQKQDTASTLVGDNLLAIYVLTGVTSAVMCTFLIGEKLYWKYSKGQANLNKPTKVVLDGATLRELSSGPTIAGLSKIL